MLTLTGETSPGSEAPFLDTFRVLHPQDREAGTFNGFKLGATTGEKIDYILAQPATEALRGEIVRKSRDKGSPPDHFPVVARVRFQVIATTEKAAERATVRLEANTRQVARRSGL